MHANQQDNPNACFRFPLRPRNSPSPEPLLRVTQHLIRRAHQLAPRLQCLNLRSKRFSAWPLKQNGSCPCRQTPAFRQQSMLRVSSLYSKIAVKPRCLKELKGQKGQKGGSGKLKAPNKKNKNKNCHPPPPFRVSRLPKRPGIRRFQGRAPPRARRSAAPPSAGRGRRRRRWGARSPPPPRTAPATQPPSRFGPWPRVEKYVEKGGITLHSGVMDLLLKGHGDSR